MNQSGKIWLSLKNIDTITRDVLEAFLIHRLCNLCRSASSLSLIEDELAHLEDCLVKK